MKSTIQSYLEKKITIIVFAILLTSYFSIRAAVLSITFDEVASYQIMNLENWWDITITANNHLLNTTLMKYSVEFFGLSEFTLRLPNILGGILFLFFSALIGRLLFKKKAIYFLLVLWFNPFLIDFFSIARGYGLSIGFMTLSLFCLFRFFYNQNIWFGVGTILSAQCAVLSNLTLFNYLLPMLASFGLIFLIRKRKNLSWFTDLLIYFGILLTFFYYLLPAVFELKENGELYFGGRTGFYQDSIYSLGRCFAYYKTNMTLGKILFFFLFSFSYLFSLINIGISIYKKKITTQLVMAVIIILGLLASIVQHEILNSNFTSERTALMYFPLTIISLFLGISDFKLKFNLYLKEVLASVFVFQFLWVANFHITYSWRYQGNALQVMKFINEECKNTNKNIKLGINYIYNPPVFYYREQMNLQNLDIILITNCWEFKLDLEELDPYYFGAGEFSRLELLPQDLEKFYLYDFYYIDKFFYEELVRFNIEFETILNDPKSRSYLIKVHKLN